MRYTPGADAAPGARGSGCSIPGAARGYNTLARISPPVYGNNVPARPGIYPRVFRGDTSPRAVYLTGRAALTIYINMNMGGVCCVACVPFAHMRARAKDSYARDGLKHKRRPYPGASRLIHARRQPLRINDEVARPLTGRGVQWGYGSLMRPPSLNAARSARSSSSSSSSAALSSGAAEAAPCSSSRVPSSAKPYLYACTGTAGCESCACPG